MSKPQNSRENLISLSESILADLESKGITREHPIHTKMLRLKTSLQGIGGQFGNVSE